jgi:NAD(P)-dependent dehydrogenase (short-subunit alcohol dehydrogenase family)
VLVVKGQRTIAITGAAGGMGTELTRILREEGCRAVGIDLHSTEIDADLSTPAGRREAVGRLRALTGGTLDGIVFCAGLSRGQPPDIVSVNYFAPTQLLAQLRDDLGRGHTPGVVAVASIAILTPGIPQELTEACLSDDEEAARALAATPELSRGAYRASKLALARRIRQVATLPKWAGSGIRLNVVVPGTTATTMAGDIMADPKRYEAAMETYGKGLGRVGEPQELAQAMAFLVGPKASYVVGQVLYVDGGGESAAHKDEIFAEARAWAPDPRAVR